MTRTLPIGLQQSFVADWFGQPPRHRAHFCLKLQSGLLHYQFRVEKSAEFDTRHQPGDFIEGLWERDVAELFLMGPGGHYHEFNLSPSGAWWCASFSGYRQRIQALPCPSARVSSRVEPDVWSASLTVDLHDIPCLEGKGLEQARLSVTSILCPGQPEYLCSGHQSGGTPDFHLASTFLGVG